jgi:hypothetical protein
MRQSQGFGNKVKQHHHKLCLTPAASADGGVKRTAYQPACAESDGKNAGREESHPFRDQGKSHGRHENATPKGYDAVDDLTLALGLGAAFDLRQDAANESGDPCQPDTSAIVAS